MTDKNLVYGSDAPVKVSFAFGSIEQAAADTYPGGLAFGFDSETNAGAIFRMGKLVSSRVLDIALSPVEDSEGNTTVTVKFVDTDGIVREKTFNAVDSTLIESLKARIATLEENASNPDTPVEPAHDYKAGDYVDIAEDFTISVKYADVLAQIKTDLADEFVSSDEIADFITADDLSDYAKTSDIPSLEGYAKTTDIPSLDGYAKSSDIENLAEKSDIKEYIGSDYVDIVDGEDDNEGKKVVSVDYTSMYNKIKGDLASAGIGDQTDINTEQSDRLLEIENGYTSDVVVEENEDASMKTVTLSLKKRESETDEFSEDEISFDVPTDKYYEDLETRLDAIEAKADASGSNSVWKDVETLLAEANAENA